VTRAVRVWAALSESERADFALETAHLGRAYELLRALDADLAEHQQLEDLLTTSPFQGFLIPEWQAGPRRPAEKCDDCGEDVTTGRIPFYDYDRERTLHLGPGCWRDRMLARARGETVAGDQLQAFPAPEPIREEP
jgi:hypothetical protein